MKRNGKRREFAPQKKKDADGKIHRFFIVAALFTLLCAIFTISLAVAKSRGPSIDDGDLNYDVRVETVSGERGRIFDRNGIMLVGNTSTYSLIFEYGSMAYKLDEVNSALLRCVSTLNSTGTYEKRATDYFVLEGTYPNMTFTSDALDKNTNTGFYYNRFLINHSLPEKSTAKDIVSFFVNRYKLSEEKYSNEEISELIRLRYDMLRVGFGEYQEYVIATDLDSTLPADMELIKQIREQNIEGATIVKQDGRVYYFDQYASHILGKTGKITAENVDMYEGYPLDATVGVSGCELTFESYLRGSEGKKVSKYDKEGNLVEQYYDPAPIVGNDIYLTLDINLQIAAEDSLAAEVERLEHSEAGAATAIDPTTGDVLVIASYPKFSESPFNRALMGTYAPGSTYKIGSALAALEQGKVSAESRYVCEHTYPYLGGPTCLGTHGSVDVWEAIRVSCNIYFYYVGHEFGLDIITPYTKRLGLGVPTGIELGEAVGSVAELSFCEESGKQWLEFDDATGAIGQSYHSYTPLQLSVYMSSIANGGTRYSAHVLGSVRSRSGEILFEKEPEVLDNVGISQETYNTLVGAMEAVVSTNDTISSYFSDVPVDVAGKTGTAEMGTYDNALFSGFGPIESPKIVASCVIEYGEAGANASKIVADIFEAYFNPKESESNENSGS